MKPIALIILFSCGVYLAIGQQQSGILRCEVESTAFKITLQNGTLSDWRPLGKLDETVVSTITFDFDKKRIFWDTKSRTYDPDFKETIEVYDINKLTRDTTYSDFGFTTIILKCINEKKQIMNYELIEFNLDNCYSLFLVENSKKFKSKHELKIVQ